MLHVIFTAVYLGHVATGMGVHSGPDYAGYGYNTTRGIAPLVRIWASYAALGQHFPGHITAHVGHHKFPTRLRISKFYSAGWQYWRLYFHNHFVLRVRAIS